MEIEPLMKMVTIDIFAKTASSADLDCCRNLKLAPFDFLLEELTHRLTNLENPSNYFYSLSTTRNRRHFAERTLLRSFLTKTFQERKNDDNSPKKNEKKKKSDLLSKLVDTYYRTEEENIDEDSNQALNDTLMALLFAGYDATSITLTYVI